MLGAVHKLCRLGRGGRGVAPKTILDDGGRGGGLRKNYVVFFFAEGKKKISEGKIAAKFEFLQ